MILQLSIELGIENRKAQAIIDLDTGFIGFNETIDDDEIEYYFGESPTEFKKALFNRLEPILADKITTNWKICRKNEKMKIVSKQLSKKK